MKKQLLILIICLTAFYTSKAQTVSCNNFPDVTNVATYETPGTYIAYSAASNELTVTYTNAPSWSDWNTATAELKIIIPSASTSTLTNPAVLYEIEVSSLTLTGTGCGDVLPLGISVVDGDNDYSTGVSSNIGYWVGLDTAHFTSINPTASIVNYGALTTIAIKPATPAGCTVSGSFKLRNVCIGEEPVTTSVLNKTSNNITNSKIYPNPTSDMAKIEMELTSVSDVKVTLTDLMGKEVMTITEGSTAFVNSSFNVSALNKGIYTVNYTVNGSAAKTELLMVK